jgi:hypothetical protein
MHPTAYPTSFRAFDRRSQPRLPKELSGKWVAWDRDETRIVATGDTFDEAKQSAAAAGQSAVLMARVPMSSQFRFRRPLLSMVAVFISQMT